MQVARWRERYAASRGLQGIEQDLPRGAPPVKVDVAQSGGADHADQAGGGDALEHAHDGRGAGRERQPRCMRHWQAHGLKPHRVRGFKLSRDPKFVEKLEDIVGLYMSPPEHALVLCCDEKSQMQALDRTQPGLPLKKGRAATMTHDYKRNGTTTLFAALNVLDGTSSAQCQQRHRHEEWLKFLRLIDRETPKDKKLHLICRQLRHAQASQGAGVAGQASALQHALHAHLGVVAEHGRALLPRHHRPSACAAACFTSVPELIAAIEEYIAHHNNNPKPFIWTKSARDILQKVIRANQPLKFQTERSTTLALL